MPLSEAEYTALAVSDHLALNARLDSPPDSVTQSPRSAYSTDALLGPTSSQGSEKGRGKGKREREEARTCGVSGRTVERTIFAIVVFALLTLVIVSRENDYARWREMIRKLCRKLPSKPVNKKILNFDTPQPNFRQNLRKDLAYVTGFPYGGLTNQLVSLFKLVHIAQRLDREALLPDLNPAHDEGEFARYSEFFDLDYFSTQSQVAMAEWGDVMTTNSSSSTEKGELACWGHSTWSNHPLALYNTQTWFWPFPEQLQSKYFVETSITFAGIDVLNSGDNTEWLMSKVKSWFGSIEKSPPLPDRHLLCFQNLFYASTVKFVEGQVDQSVDIEELRRDGPIWNTVGQFLRFTPRVDHIVDEMLEALIGDASQPFIAIHLRQGDFLTLGRTSNETSSIKDTYSKGLDQLHTILATLPILDGFDVTRLPVLLATDSTDPVLLANLSSLGWKLIDHGKLETRKKYGGWYPGVLDSAILSRAVGLVGTKMSTFTYLAERRIESWNGGASVIVGL